MTIIQAVTVKTNYGATICMKFSPDRILAGLTTSIWRTEYPIGGSLVSYHSHNASHYNTRVVICEYQNVYSRSNIYVINSLVINL